MRILSKKDIVDEITKLLNEFDNVYLLSPTGIKEKDLRALRRQIKINQGKIKWVKNTLLSIALSTSKYKDVASKIEDLLTGPTCIVGIPEPQILPNLIINLFKEKAKDIFKGGIVFSEVYKGKDGLITCLKLKSKNSLIREIILILKSPLFRIIYALKQKQNQSI